jgi:hypothetical protein
MVRLHLRGRTAALAFSVGWVVVMAEVIAFGVLVPMWRGTTPKLGYLGTVIAFGLLSYVAAFLALAASVVLRGRYAATMPTTLAGLVGICLFAGVAVAVNALLAGSPAAVWHEVVLFVLPGLAAALFLLRRADPAGFASASAQTRML